MCHLLSGPCCSGASRAPNFVLVLRQFSRRENSAKPSTWKGGNAFGSMEPQVTTTSETSRWEDQRLNRCFGYVLLKTPRPRHSMQARLPIRSVLLPQSCVGGVNVPSLWRADAILQDRCQCHSTPSTGCWPSASLRFRMAATRDRARAHIREGHQVISRNGG